ncbi:MAG: hypothetical protein A3F75_07885 [Betaproteobacteria bacterium RIFCSPLOWO2_12_FULL_64_23]|nr:MAG: hypothetical protein A3F75_07885 [Betaproteobacteria bacterium RIFCSPLOWO2_12_FULL_64_23]
MKIAIAATVFALFASMTAHAQQDYPNRPIRLIVPFTAGSTSDISARLIGQKISESLGQPVLVENRPGASGTIGMQAVAKSKPDGYTLAVGSVSSTVVPQVLMKTPPFELLRDFVPVALIASTALVLVVNKDSPANSVQDLVAEAKREPGKGTYGNSAGLYQLCMELFKLQAGIDLLAVGYKGPADAATDLIAGRLTVMPDSLGAATRNIQAGRTKALAVLSTNRSAALPGVPTMTELGYKDFDFNGWIGILAPAGTPDAIVQRLNLEINRAAALDEVKQKFTNMALDAVRSTPREYAETLARETAKYAKIVKDANIERQ